MRQRSNTQLIGVLKMPKKRVSDPKQVRQSVADRKARGEYRLIVSTWVEAKHADTARAEGKAAFLEAVKKYKRKV